MNALLLDRVTEGAARGGRWCAIALGFSLPLSVALDNLLLAALLLLWVLARQTRTIVRTVSASPVFACVAGIAALHGVGLLYTIADPPTALAGAWTGLRLLFLIVLVPQFTDPRTRTLALRAFAAAMTLTLCLSFLVAADVLPHAEWLKGTPANPVVFKYHITHNLLMALAALAFALLARAASSAAARCVFCGLALLAALNVLFVVGGRTGHVVVLLLIPYFFVSWMRWRGIAIATVVLAAVLTAAALLPETAIRARFAIAVDEYRTYVPGENVSTSSIGSRLSYYRNSIAIFAAHPLAGVGTGGFAPAYAARVVGTPMEATENPHNEYLLMATQFGVPGLLLICALFVLAWRDAKRIPDPTEHHLARGMVIAFAAASAVSSTFMDHTEGLLFVWLAALVFSQTLRGDRTRPSCSP